MKVQDVKSAGNRSKIEGLKSGRTHHTLSNIESELFYLLEFSDHIIDIREQLRLFPMDLAQRIASDMEIAYPKKPSTWYAHRYDNRLSSHDMDR